MIPVRGLRLAIAIAVAAFAATGPACAPERAFQIDPPAVEIAPTEAIVFTLSGSRSEPLAGVAAAWSVVEPEGGTIDASGRYVAPDAEGVFHVVAEVSAVKQVAEVRVKRNVRVVVEPATASLPSGGSIALTATVSGGPDKGVAWSVAEGAAGGTVTSSGVYTAPSTAGTYTVLATSTADLSRSGQAVITVTEPPAPPPPPPPEITVAVAPAAATVAAGETLQLAATVTGSSAGVSWSVQEGDAGGSVSASGLYTAPGTAGTYHVVAASQADASRTAIATLTVTAPPNPSEPTADVTRYGAVGDGVTDDTAAFRRAAATGLALLVPRPPAHYRISAPISLDQSMYGVDMPEIRMYGTSGGRLQHMFDVTENTAPSVTIRGVRLDGQYVTGDGSGEWGHNILLRGATNVLIEGNELVRAKGDGVLVGGEGSPRQSVNVTIRDNTLQNPRRCTVAVIAGRNVRIEGNRHLKVDPYVSAIDLEPNPYDGEWMEDVVIADNTFEVPRGIAILLWSWPQNPYANRRITITGNSGRARRFVQKPNGVGTWESIVVSGNTYLGDPGVSGEYLGLVEVAQNPALPEFVNDVLVQGNVVTNAIGPGQTYGDYFRGVRSLRVIDNRYEGALPYALTVTESPGAVVTGTVPSSVVRIY